MSNLVEPNHSHGDNENTRADRDGTPVGGSSRADEQHATMENASGARASFPSTDRRAFLQGAVATAAALVWPRGLRAQASDLDAIRAEVGKRHDEAVKRLQEWIRQPSIAAENRGMNEGCDLTMRLLREAGFVEVTKVPTD